MPKDKNNKQETIKLTADSLIKDAMCLEPAAALKLVVQELGAKSGKDLLASHLKQLVPLIAKNGWYKAKDLGKSVAGFGKKNKEDSTGIDFANADIDMSTMKTRRVADGKCVAELEKLAAVFQKEASVCVKEAEAASKKLEADCKSSDVELSREEMSDHAIEVAAVVDSKESKGKKRQRAH